MGTIAPSVFIRPSWPDWTILFGVTCPCLFSHRLMIAPSLFIVLSSNLQVTMTAIKSRTSLNSGHLFPLTLELPATECRKKSCRHNSAFSFYQTFFKLADIQDRHKISDEFNIQLNPSFDFESYLPLSVGKNVVNTIAPSVLI